MHGVAARQRTIQGEAFEELFLERCTLDGQTLDVTPDCGPRLEKSTNATDRGLEDRESRQMQQTRYMQRVTPDRGPRMEESIDATNCGLED